MLEKTLGRVPVVISEHALRLTQLLKFLAQVLIFPFESLLQKVVDFLLLSPQKLF